MGQEVALGHAGALAVDFDDDIFLHQAGLLDFDPDKVNNKSQRIAGQTEVLALLRGHIRAAEPRDRPTAGRITPRERGLTAPAGSQSEHKLEPPALPLQERLYFAGLPGLMEHPLHIGNRNDGLTRQLEDP